MGIIESIVLGIVEGATEFVPVSSSGHLVLVHKLFEGTAVGSVGFDAVIQFATALAVVVYFWRDILRLIQTFFKWITGKVVAVEDSTMLLAIILGTIPALVFGLILEKKLDTVFRNVWLVAIALLAGSILMYFADRYTKQTSTLTVKKGVIIGFFQSLALFTGFSRSGATISGGLILGFTREAAARFSFLLSLPIILGSGLLKLYEMLHKGGLVNGQGLPLIISSIVAFGVGLASIHFLLNYLKNHPLKVFVWYRVVLAVVIVILLV